MRIQDNCQGGSALQGTSFRCPYLRNPAVHSGYTGKSGPQTWTKCVLKMEYIRNIKKCDLAAKPIMQKDYFHSFHGKIE